MKDDDPTAVSISVDLKGKTIRLKPSRAFEADLMADVIWSEYPEDPVEAGRQIWIFVAPVFRELGWRDEKIAEVYRIPPEVLSGEADRRARISLAEYRLSWINQAPQNLYDGEAEVIALTGAARSRSRPTRKL